MAARTSFVSAGLLIVSPSERSIARHSLPPKPLLKSLSGSLICAPWANVTLTFPLWALPTAIVPSRDQTGLPKYFQSSTISGSASSTHLRTAASVLLRQSVSSASIWSTRSDGFIWSAPRQFESLNRAKRAAIEEPQRDDPLAR